MGELDILGDVRFSEPILKYASRQVSERLERLTVLSETDPVSWIQSNINLSNDPTSASDGRIKLDSYQIAPIRAQFDSAVREVVIVGPEQTGKSICWRLPLVYKMLYSPGPRLIVYESDEKAEDINSEQLHPLLLAVPQIASWLTRKTNTKRRYKLPNGTITEFSGAGADITSKPELDGVADELDSWNMPAAQIRANLLNFKKRFRTYWRRNRGCLVVVSSPKGSDSQVWDEWLGTSRGKWHLRCQKCGQLTMDSSHLANLQWDEKSIVLVCPTCKHEHSEKQAQAMNEQGAYIHHTPEQKSRLGYQWGALASPRTWGWQEIREAQEAAGKSASREAQVYLDNSVKGIPFHPRKAQEASIETVKKHCAALPDPASLTGVFLAADTQDNGWYWIVRGIDQNESTYLLGQGFCRTLDELRAVWDAEYHGQRCMAGIIDEGGHRGVEVQRLVESSIGLYSYKGNPRIGKRYTISREDKHRLLAIPQQFQAELLYLIYSQESRENNYWFLPPEVSQDYAEQIASLRPNKSVKSGDHFENWTAPDTSPDHYFDAEKMLRVLLAYALDQPKFPWRSGSPDTWRKPRAAVKSSQRRKGTVNSEAML